MIALIGVLAMIFVMQIPMDPGDLLRVLALAPILAIAGGALGVLFIGFVQRSQGRRPRRGAAGLPADVPVGRADPDGQLDGLLGLLSKLMPMTYSIDLARNIFYAGKPEYAVSGAPPDVVGPAVTRRRVRRVHRRRHDDVRPARSEPLRPASSSSAPE